MDSGFRRSDEAEISYAIALWISQDLFKVSAAKNPVLSRETLRFAQGDKQGLFKAAALLTEAPCQALKRLSTMKYQQTPAPQIHP